MRTVAVAMMVVGLMGPQSIHAKDRTDVEGIDIVVAMDLSGSMEAADVAPNRFLASKAVVGQFIVRRPNDRIGAVIFGREAYTLLPLTTDHETLRNMVSELELGMIDGRGTAIGNALGVSLNRLRSSHAKTKIVILLTDGNSNSGNVSPDQAADFAKTMHVKVYTILMGQSDEAPQQQGTDLFGNPIFRRAPSPINPELLRNMATHTGGEAYRATDRNGLEQSFHSILDRLERSQIEDAGRVYGELFPAFVGPALILLLLELILAVFVFRRFP
ncbi:MAG: VWA domain-containing protein [Sandaracinaceae bacterium]|nr:VWA domain-containing protein [Sandaracinaceae bacterium]